MKLNRNSISVKLYRWFYGTVRLPENLCPYFWKLVLAYILFIPYSIFCIPNILFMEVLNKNYENGDHSTGARMGISFGYYLIAFVLLCMVTAAGYLFVDYEKDGFFDRILPGGILFWIAGIGIGGYHGIKYLIERYKEKRDYYIDENGRRWYKSKEKTDNIIIAFTKAKYNKYCPKIEWVNPNDNNGK
jgi:hypothetical protein